MPAPVSFSLSLAPLPVDFSGTPQELATAIVDRLSIEPSEPWSSFQNGGAIGTSDVGPILYQGKEWRVWDSGLGAYTYHKQNGAGLVNATVPLTKISDGTAGSVLIYDADGRPAEKLKGASPDGSVLTLVDGLPAWADTFVPGKQYFEATLGSAQSLNTNASAQKVLFDTVRASANVTFDTSNNRVPVTAGEVWFFYTALQIEDTDAPSTDVQVQLDICRAGVNNGASSVVNFASLASRFSMYAAGIFVISSTGYVDVYVTPQENTPSATGLEIANNATNTRFGGYRII